MTGRRVRTRIAEESFRSAIGVLRFLIRVAVATGIVAQDDRECCAPGRMFVYSVRSAVVRVTQDNRWHFLIVTAHFFA